MSPWTGHADSLPPEAYILPAEPTPAVMQVLRLRPWEIMPIARVLQRAGFSVPKRAEDEQAHVLFFLLPFAIAYGDDWWRRAQPVLAGLIPKEGPENDHR